MIVIPPQDPNERQPDPAEEALGKLYDQFTNVQNLAEFHTALRKRDALYELQHQEMGDSPQEFENLHPRDFYRQFDRRADEDDKIVTSEAPYRVREQLKGALWAERDTAKGRALETYKKLFIDHQLGKLDTDRMYYLGKIADASSDQDRERYISALIGRLKLSGDVGLLYKEDADRLIENLPSDLDIFTYNREFAADPARAQRLLLYGAYPNIRPELREQLVNAANEANPGLRTVSESQETAQTEGQPIDTQGHSTPNDGESPASKEAIEDESDATDASLDYQPGDLALAAQTNSIPQKNPGNSTEASPPRAVRAHHVEPRPKDRVVYIEYDKGPAEIRWDGSWSWRNNNPGNLEAGKFSREQGAIGADDRFAIFPDEETGETAMYNKIYDLSDAGFTVDQAIEEWAPPRKRGAPLGAIENDTAKYKADVHGWTGLKGNERLSSLTDAQIESFANAIRRREGWIPGKVTYDE